MRAVRCILRSLPGIRYLVCLRCSNSDIPLNICRKCEIGIDSNGQIMLNCICNRGAGLKVVFVGRTQRAAAAKTNVAPAESTKMPLFLCLGARLSALRLSSEAMPVFFGQKMGWCAICLGFSPLHGARFFVYSAPALPGLSEKTKP